jgi:integrase
MKGTNVSERVTAILAPHGGGTAHQLRHWAGTRWYQVSRDLLATATLMGHANPKTTMGYARFDLEKAGVKTVQMVDLPKFD